MKRIEFYKVQAKILLAAYFTSLFKWEFHEASIWLARYQQVDFFLGELTTEQANELVEGSV